MEFKRCPRCGKFFHSDLDVCQACKVNESLDIQKLKNYFEENEYSKGITVQDISIETGINSRNLNRFLITDEFSGYINQEDTKK